MSATPTPHVETIYRCAGCPCLKTEDWSFEEENDGVDRGTTATCTAVSPIGHMGNYWSSSDRTPSWCPFFASPQPPTPAGVREMRLETVSENIARDMAEGRFPEQSDPKMVEVTDEDEDACEQAASDALEFVMKKLPAIKKEKGLVGVWMNAWRLAWKSGRAAAKGAGE